MSTPALSKRLITARAVGHRYGGRHPRTVKEWAKRGIIPPPCATIAGKHYWDEEQLDRADRERTALAGSQPKPSKAAQSKSHETVPE
jgi:hypothetical protein